MAEPMNIWELEEYAQKHGGFNSGRFIAVNEKGIFEMKFLDAYMGIVEFLQPKPKAQGFVRTKELREYFGSDQKYLPTIGYEDTDE